MVEIALSEVMSMRTDQLLRWLTQNDVALPTQRKPKAFYQVLARQKHAELETSANAYRDHAAQKLEDKRLNSTYVNIHKRSTSSYPHHMTTRSRAASLKNEEEVKEEEFRFEDFEGLDVRDKVQKEKRSASIIPANEEQVEHASKHANTRSNRSFQTSQPKHEVRRPKREAQPTSPPVPNRSLCNSMFMFYSIALLWIAVGIGATCYVHYLKEQQKRHNWWEIFQR
ncbi:hypothetical protein O6H91_19G077600 [Diphasiastrum complanatum]|uniref:Uncharacterized protein n=1 Tax=Diphasiastrum complanatum TaxID=34168 RepID=A0ACC2AX13_DIPCM|nr:hypothetical protein O6H91_19G077600 [Diphasiastrum complanatum]